MQNLQGGWLIGVENIDIPTGEINICEQMRNLKSKHHYFKWTLYLFSQGKSAAVQSELGNTSNQFQKRSNNKNTNNNNVT